MFSLISLSECSILISQPMGEPTAEREVLSLALSCVNSARECDGCGECGHFDSGAECECCLCMKRISLGNAYEDAVFSPLCLSCLKAVHKL